MSALKIQLFLLAVIMLTVAAAAADTPAGQEPVTPGRLYSGQFLDIRSPESEGWYLIGSSGVSMEFAREGLGQGERYGAQVLLFPLPEASSREEFMSLIKERFKAHSERFSIIKSDFSFSDARSYPCARVSAVAEKKSRASPDQGQGTILQFDCLYCRHPSRKETGFAIIYSHRGTSPDPNLEAEMQSFAAGVQVPGHQ